MVRSLEIPHPATNPPNAGGDQYVTYLREKYVPPTLGAQPTNEGERVFEQRRETYVPPTADDIAKGLYQPASHAGASDSGLSPNQLGRYERLKATNPEAAEALRERQLAKLERSQKAKTMFENIAEPTEMTHVNQSAEEAFNLQFSRRKH